MAVLTPPSLTAYVVTSLLEAGLNMPQAPFGWAVQACRDGHIPWRLVWETIQDLRQGQVSFVVFSRMKWF
jgi:hypothetical protein